MKGRWCCIDERYIKENVKNENENKDKNFLQDIAFYERCHCIDNDHKGEKMEIT